MRTSATRAAYWLATALVALFMLWSAYGYLAYPAAVAECHRLGFPDWFRVELAVAKGLGALALVAPGLGPRPREWAYAGFTVVLVSAAGAHLAAGDGAGSVGGIAALLGLLAASYGLRPAARSLAQTA